MSGSMHYCLQVLEGSSRRAVLILSEGEERVIGSGHGADLFLSGAGVEGRHARVRFEAAELHVVDISRKRSMRVNGERKNSARLESGDQLSLGSVTLDVSLRGGNDVVSPARHVGLATPTDMQKLSTSVVGVPAESPPGGGAAALVAPDRERFIRRGLAGRRLEREPSTRPGSLEERGLWWPKDQLPPLELQHVWFDLARDEGWRSLAVVPTDNYTPALPVAHAFARMASLNPNTHVLVVDASPRIGERCLDGPFAGTIASQVNQFPQANYDFLDASTLGMNDAEVAHLYVPQLLEYIGSGTGHYNKVLIATGSLISNARSIPVARAVDAVLLNVGKGTSRLPDVDRTAEIVGRGRVVGSIVVEPID
jgi:hypothetical protein